MYFFVLSCTFVLIPIMKFWYFVLNKYIFLRFPSQNYGNLL